MLRAGDDVVIVAFGDSITAGYAVRHGFPYFWKQALQEKYPAARIEMHNEGVSGDTTWDGLARLELSVLYHKPDLVTMNFGINDAAYGISLRDLRANIVKMVETILECGSEVILLSSQPLLTPYYKELVLDYYHALGEIAEALGVGFVDVYAAWMERVRSGIPLESLILEGLDHPNEDGYKIIADELMKLF